VVRLPDSGDVTASGFCLNQEDATSANSNMVNVPIRSTGQIVKAAKANVCDFA